MDNREAEISKRIELLKRKNERLEQRYKEIEADRKNAEKSGCSVNTHYSDYPAKPETGARHSRAHMDEMNEPRESPASTYRPTPSHHIRGRGTPNTGRRYDRGRGRGGRQHYDTKRMENYRMVEEELAQTHSAESPSAPEFGVSRFLDDPRRKGDLNPEDRYKSSRHKGSFGGLEFENVKREVRNQRRGYYNQRGGRGRGNSKLQMSAELTGRERQDQERWMAMREAADREIMARSKNTQGQWRREWDMEKNRDFEDDGYHKSRNHHNSGPARRGTRGGRGSGRRGSRSGWERGKERRENGEAEGVKETLPESNIDKDQDPTSPLSKDEENESPEKPDTSEQKPQRQRNKRNKNDRKKVSPKHLAQQRAQTPSSKDGTEVWAQNSHHSDEAGAEWKNGASRSTEQWLPSDEGNRNPAIDERMLEQQEVGATVYSRQLGRGWGDEKNIKATKAWVIDTEKARSSKDKLKEGVPDNSRGRNEGRTFGKMYTSRKDKVRTEAEKLKDDAVDKTRLRSASPRLKRDNPGLTVEIRPEGGRRVKRYSEGDSVHVDKKNPPKGDTEPKNDSDDVKSPTNTPLSPSSFMKTPEGLDWAAEMDMLSPTYTKRQLQLQEMENTENPSHGEKTVPENKPTADKPQMELDKEKVSDQPVPQDGKSEVQSQDANPKTEETSIPDLAIPLENVDESNAKETEQLLNDQSDDKDEAGEISENMDHETLQVESNDGTVEEEEQLDTSNEDQGDGGFKDAEDGVEGDDGDEFYECDEEADHSDIQKTEDQEVEENRKEEKRAESTEVNEDEPSKESSAENGENVEEEPLAPAAASATESIQTVVTETVITQPAMSNNIDEEPSAKSSTIEENTDSVNDTVTDTSTETSGETVKETSLTAPDSNPTLSNQNEEV